MELLINPTTVHLEFKAAGVFANNKWLVLDGEDNEIGYLWLNRTYGMGMEWCFAYSSRPGHYGAKFEIPPDCNVHDYAAEFIKRFLSKFNLDCNTEEWDETTNRLKAHP